MKTIIADNIYTLPERKTSTVGKLPGRSSTSASVLSMPLRPKRSKVVTLIARSHSGLQPVPESTSALRAGAQAISAGVRMTLVALFALLGWPHPSRDNDPGPSSARPGHWQKIELISQLPMSRTKSAAIAAETNRLARAA